MQVILNIVLAIVAVAAGTGLITAAMVLFANASTSKDQTAQRRLRVVEVLISPAMFVFYALTAQSTNQRRWVAIVGAVVLAAWMFRGIRSLRRTPKSNITRT